jgi:hypothetical protein
MSENKVLRAVWLAVGRISRVFRLNTGRGWVPTRGKAKKFKIGGVIHLQNGTTISVHAGDVLVPGGRPIALGFGMPNGRPFEGIGDLVGWTEITITAEMVGFGIAVFTNIETKSSADARKRASQHNVIAQVKAAGGIAGFAHTPEMAREMIVRFTPVR